MSDPTRPPRETGAARKPPSRAFASPALAAPHPGRPRGLAPGILAALAGALLLLSGCHVTPYQRTLPQWVQRVHVPMAANKTYEPGLEELVTNAFAAELLADGRLEVTRKAQADTIVRITLYDYQETSDSFENDNVEDRREIRLRVGMDLFDPKDLEHPVLQVPAFTVRFTYASDYRSYSSELDVNARQRLGETAAMQMLGALMSNAQPVSR